MAHYDTKSQLFPTGVRVALVVGVRVLCAVGVLLSVPIILGYDASIPAMSWIIGVSAMVLLAGLICNVTGNRSPGALDNGSAVGTLLELARSWRPHSHAPVEALWVATGSEEVELDGARHFLRRRKTWWHEKPTLLINLESVGAGIYVYLAGESRALQLARATAEALDLPHARLRVVAAGMDHEPFAAGGLAAVSILGDVLRTSLALHSSRDDMRLIDPLALERAGQLAAHLAWRWAELHA
jgi:Zn-dependent M28 family amino/carboxypeptidase